MIAGRARDLGPALNVDVGDPVRAIAATPSGDRLFVALADEEVLRIVDRFEEGVTGRIRLPAPARAAHSAYSAGSATSPSRCQWQVPPATEPSASHSVAVGQCGPATSPETRQTVTGRKPRSAG